MSCDSQTMSRLDHVKRFHLFMAGLKERLGWAIRLAVRIDPERLDDLSAGWGVVFCGQTGTAAGVPAKNFFGLVRDMRRGAIGAFQR